MEALGIIFVIGLVVGIYFLQKAAGRAGNALERKIRSGAAASEDELLHTVVRFRTSASLSSVRQAMAQTVEVKSSIWSGRAKVISDSDRGIAWEYGSVAAGSGFKAQVAYSIDGSSTTGVYSITSHSRSGGVSSYIKEMTERRNQVISAFKSADPNVEITTGQQEMTRTRK